jgi:outer membrane protein OmpA-like peptidoglycan-associated protein
MNKLYWLTTLLILQSFATNAQFWKISEPYPLSVEVNSQAEESTPFFSQDSSILYFTRTYDPRNTGGQWDQDIWFSTRSENGESYNEAQNLKSLNNKFNNAVVGISSDGNRIYLLDAYQGKKDLVKGLAVAERNVSGSWGTPERVEIPTLKIDGDFYGFYVSSDEKVIIISYKGPETLGEEDLYISENMNGTWTEPKHMGSDINSEGYEISPFLNNSKDTLFFSSNGMEGQGDADIFYSVKTGEDWTTWSKPTNLNLPINSSKFDAYINISNDIIYFSSNRDSLRSDIYRATAIYYRFVGTIRDKETLDPLEGTHIVIKNRNKEDVLLEELYTDEAGKLLGNRLPYKYEELIKLKILIERDGYIGKSLTLEKQLGDTTDIDLSALLDVNLTKIEEGKTDLADVIDINPIYFDLNSSVIRPDAEKELDKVVEIMNDNPKIIIELRSHTDNRASNKYNLWLSDKRAKSSAEYIVSQGISIDRIKGQGYGEQQLKISDAEIEKASSEEEKERLHQKNRRTEFIIVGMN